MTSTYGKENAALRPYLRKYANVDENEIHRRQHSSSYLLLKDDKPDAAGNVSCVAHP